MKKISTIIPVYNVADYIQECVESVLNQTVKPYEIILVDDGSTDNSPAVCDMLAKQYDTVKVVHQSNGGLANARNTGLDNATGDYISFIDSDDIIHYQMYEILLGLSEKTNSDIAMCKYCFFDEDVHPHFSPFDVDFEISKAEIFNAKNMLENYNSISSSVSIVSCCMKLYRKDVFSAYRLKEGYVNEDSIALPYILNNSNIVSMVTTPLYYWRERRGSLSRDGITSKLFSYIAVDYFTAEFFANEFKNKKQRSVFCRRFFEKTLKYHYLIYDGHLELACDFIPYKKLYRKVFIKYWTFASMCKMERLAYFLYLFSPKLAKKYYKKVYPE